MSVRQNSKIAEIKLYKPAKTIESVIREYGFEPEQIIKLAGNESRFGISHKVMEALENEKNQFSFYPDVEATKLREILSGYHHIDKEHFIFGNGSFELISLIGSAYIEAGDEAVYTDPSFGWYINATLANDGKVIKVPVTEDQEVDVDGILDVIHEKTKVIWLCNPNNPTGTLIPWDDLNRLVNKTPDSVLIVLDEAYIDFNEEEYPDTVNLVKEHENVILLRTFSKAYGLASFRIGYAIAALDVIEGLNKVKLPINTSHAAQVAAIASFQDAEYKDYVVREINAQKKIYYEAFERMGFRYIRSHTNFILVNTGMDGAELEQEFLKRGIMLRSGEAFGPGYKEWLRISIGKPEDNRKVIRILEELKGGDI